MRRARMQIKPNIAGLNSHAPAPAPASANNEVPDKGSEKLPNSSVSSTKQAVETEKSKAPENLNGSNRSDSAPIAVAAPPTVQPTTGDEAASTAKPSNDKPPAAAATGRRGRFMKAMPNISEATRTRSSNVPVAAVSDDESNKRPPSVTQKPMAAPSVPEVQSAAVDAIQPMPATEVTSAVRQVASSEQLRFSAAESLAAGRSRSDVTSSVSDSALIALSELGTDGASKKKVRKRRAVHSLTEPVDKSMMIKELIYCNPNSAPMQVLQRGPQVVAATAAANADDADDEEGGDGDEEDTQPGRAPQVKIGPDGNIILNPESLIVRQPVAGAKVAEMHTVHEDNDTWVRPYGAPRKYTKQWTARETKNFYIALSSVGTDFTMMSRTFPHRSREELKRKFKKEEKARLHLVDAVLGNSKEFNLSQLDEVFKSDDEKKEAEKMEAKRKKREAAKEKAAAKKMQTASKRPTSAGRRGSGGVPNKKRSRYYDNSDESEGEDVWDNGGVQREPQGQVLREAGAASDEDSNNNNNNNAGNQSETSRAQDDRDPEVAAILLPTRAGRQPKRATLFDNSISTESASGVPRKPRVPKAPAPKTPSNELPPDVVATRSDEDPEGDDDAVSVRTEESSTFTLDGGSSDEEPEISGILRPTRSGRQPKRTAAFDNSYTTALREGLLRDGVLMPSYANRSDAASVCDNISTVDDDDIDTVESFVDEDEEAGISSLNSEGLVTDFSSPRKSKLQPAKAGITKVNVTATRTTEGSSNATTTAISASTTETATSTALQENSIPTPAQTSITQAPPLLMSPQRIQQLADRQLTPGQVVLVTAPGAESDVVHVYVVPPTGIATAQSVNAATVQPALPE